MQNIATNTRPVTNGEIAPYLKKTNLLCERTATLAFDWPERRTSSTLRAMKAAAGILLEPGFPPEMPEDVAALAKILAECKVSPDNYCYYRMFEEHYCHGGTTAQKAARLDISRSTYYDNLGRLLAYCQGRLQERGIAV